jgi:hypothetical protein
MTKITIQDVKTALKNPSFRKTLPIELKDDVAKFDRNPNCTCNLNTYVKVLKLASKQLRDWFPNKEMMNPDTDIAPIQQNNWTVINCTKDELEQKLKELPPGRKQLAISRYQDEITVVVNDLDGTAAMAE